MIRKLTKIDRELSPNEQLYHLSLDRKKDTWKVRPRLQIRNNLVGMPVTIAIGKCDQAIAISKRYTIIADYEKAGLSVCIRTQKCHTITAIEKIR